MFATDTSECCDSWGTSKGMAAEVVFFPELLMQAEHQSGLQHLKLQVEAESESV